ncbi:MAG: phage terminase large subunit family protein, partial [Victivallales bacterium]|nr:phage terminase large subunit family protein [Victivallales bacterium]
PTFCRFQKTKTMNTSRKVEKFLNGGDASKKAKEYTQHRSLVAERKRKQSISGRDIGDLPEVKNPARKARCKESLQAFIEEYIRDENKFNLPWSSQHIEVMRIIEKVIRRGDKFALAMPRGSGKTSILEKAMLWGALYGWRKFLVIIAESSDAAYSIMSTIKEEIETNERLQEDFPEVCYPVKCLARVVQRCQGQHIHGKPTRMQWSAGDRIKFPTVERSVCSGTELASLGITGQIRGLKTSEDQRPDMVLIDDIQSDESAASPDQCKKRLDIIRGTILGLAGVGKIIAAFLTCTVIKKDDVADTLLNPEISPEWHGKRYALLPKMPTNREIWNQYAEIWKTGHREERGNAPANAFYLAHRAELDEGAEAGWEARYNPDEISAIQHGMNLYISNPEAFAAEYQNRPLEEELGDKESIRPEQVLARISGVERFKVPFECDRLTAFIDVQQDMLFYTVMAFAQDWTAHVIDYGAYPDPKKHYFTLRDAGVSYVGKDGFDASLQEALGTLTTQILGRSYQREDGLELAVDRCLVDSGWGKSTIGIYNFCARSDFRRVLLASKGVGITADKKPYNEYQRGRGDTIGDFWMIASNRRKRVARVIEYDTNFVKSLWRSRLLTPQGMGGNFYVFGEQGKKEPHRMFAEQLSAEYSTPTAGRSRRVDVWKAYPNRDNHFLDCVVGCYVAASERGLRMEDIGRKSGSDGTEDAPTLADRPGRRFAIPPEFLVKK